MTALPWIGTSLQVLGAVIMALNLRVSRWAYPVMLAGSTIWLGLALLRGDSALALMMAVFSAINVVGIVRWVL